MNLQLTDSRVAVNLQSTPLHLGLGCRSRPVEGFTFEPAALDAYAAAVADDGNEAGSSSSSTSRAAGTTGSGTPRVTR